MLRDEAVHGARKILLAESRALADLADRLGPRFCDAVELILNCKGSVIVTGIGKAGLVGQKIAATLASTGTPSHFVHASEALHGDLGRIRSNDCVLVLSNSGETEEILRLAPCLADLGVPIVAVTGRAHSGLARAATVVLDLGPCDEAGSLGLAPSTSTTAMLALGDALALTASELRGFRSQDFGRLHPGGSLGRRLAKVTDVMRPLERCCVAQDGQSLREIYVRTQRPARRSGAILLVNSDGKLTGIFTDSDLARLFEHKRDNAIDRPIREIMTAGPISLKNDAMLIDAIDLLAARKISELPIVDAERRPIGMIDITDVLGLLPNQPQENIERQSADRTPPAAHTTIIQSTITAALKKRAA
jgi:arabinose-5-phosphate isomerase